MKNWDSIFSTWGEGPSKTEDQKIAHAISQIKDAIRSHASLKDRDIDIIVQGSYNNRVNVSLDSDIDIEVICQDVYFSDYSFISATQKSKIMESFVPADYHFGTFKSEVEEALVEKFGRSSVTRGNKAFDITENTYRVEADVAPFFAHRRYRDAVNYLSGVQVIPDNGNPEKIINWPEQCYENGVEKNERTNKRYKRSVRILKKLAIEMGENGIASAKAIPGFLIECLVWNVPDEYFQRYDSFYMIIHDILTFLYNNTLDNEKCKEWGKVSELKFLFRTSQKWSVQDANAFVLSAWRYLEYKQ